MEQPPVTSSEPPPPTTTPPPTTDSSQQPQPQTPSTTPSSLHPLSPSANPNPKHPNPPASQPLQSQPLNPITRAPFNRPWQQNSPFPHFSSITSHSTAPSSSLTAITPAQRGGMAIGVPASQPPSSFSSLTPPSFGSQFGRAGSVTAPDSVPSTSTPQVRQSISGMQGMMGSLGSSSSLRPPPQRPLQSSLRPQTNQSTQQPHNQPWLSSSQGKPPLAPPPFRQQINPQSLQQRSHLPPQQQTAMSATASSLQSQPCPSSQEHLLQTLPASRIPQTLTHQQQMARNRGLANQRPFTPVTPPPVPPAVVEPTESCNRIISKRSIQEIVSRIDPAEWLDPEVEDILVDIADDFVESVTTYGCSLAKHRKSNILESKDILLHLERNWNMSLPGFGGDEIKCYKKPFGNDAHRERVAAIKKSISATETANTKSVGGPKG